LIGSLPGGQTSPLYDQLARPGTWMPLLNCGPTTRFTQALVSAPTAKSRTQTFGLEYEAVASAVISVHLTPMLVFLFLERLSNHHAFLGSPPTEQQARIDSSVIADIFQPETQ
jgi:hypothetical protein